MEGHFGLTVDFVTFPDETKQKIIKVRNERIADGDINFTMTDVLVWAVNIATQMSELQKQNKKLNTGDSNGISKTDRTPST